MSGIAGKSQKFTRHVLSLEEKNSVVCDIDAGLLFRFIAAKHGISERQVRAIRQKKASIVADLHAGSPPKMKKRRPSTFPDIDAEVKQFVGWLRAERIPVTPLVLKEKARTVAEKHGVTGFRGSNGWVQKFMRRHAIQRSVKLHGHAGGVCHTVRSRSMEDLRRKIAEYNPSNVYNADESGLPSRIIRRGRSGIEDGRAAHVVEDTISNDEKFDKFIVRDEPVRSTNGSDTSPSQDSLLCDIDSVHERLLQRAPGHEAEELIRKHKQEVMQLLERLA